MLRRVPRAQRERRTLRTLLSGPAVTPMKYTPLATRWPATLLPSHASASDPADLAVLHELRLRLPARGDAEGDTRRRGPRS